MLNELLYYINPLNWDYNVLFKNLTEAFAPELLLLLLLVFAVSLLRVGDYNKDSIVVHIASASIISLFLMIRFFGADNIFVFILPLIYIGFIIVRQIVRHLEFDMYDLKSETKMRNLDKENPPIPVQVIMIFLHSIGRVLYMLPLFYIMLAFEQFETAPTMIMVFLGCVIMVYSILRLISCANLVKEHVQKDREAEIRAGYITTKHFKRTQSPVQYYELLFQVGIVFSGLTFYIGVGQWFVVLVGYIMTLRLLKKQAADHENTRRLLLKQNGDYKKYSRTTPIFYPFWPKYSLLKPESTAVITKQVIPGSKEDTPAAEEEGEQKGKKKRPPKGERPAKAERPKKEPKEKKEKKDKKEAKDSGEKNSKKAEK